MEVNYNVTVEDGDILRLRIYTLRTTDPYAQICVNQCIKKEDFKKAGNLIDRATMPFRLCYCLLKQFQERVIQELLKYNDYILDANLKNSIIDYTKDIMQDKVELMPQEMFRQMLSEVEQFNESLNN